MASKMSYYIKEQFLANCVKKYEDDFESPEIRSKKFELIIRVSVPGETPASDSGIWGYNKLIKEHVISKLHLKNLPNDIEELKGKDITVLNIATIIYEMLRSKIREEIAIKVKVFESEKVFAEYPPGLQN